MVFNPFAGGITPRKQQTTTAQTKQKPATTQSALQSFAVPSLTQQNKPQAQPAATTKQANLNPFVQAAQQKQQLPSAQGAQGQKQLQPIASHRCPRQSICRAQHGQHGGNRQLRGQIQQQTQVGSGLIAPPLNPAQIPVTPQKPAEVFQGGAPPVQGNLLEAQEDILRQLIGGPTDTSADEAALRASQKAALDEQMLNSRARAAGLGFGAENALQGDLQTRGNIALESAVSDLRRDARQDDLERALAGIGAISQDRSQDRADAEWNPILRSTKHCWILLARSLGLHQNKKPMQHYRKRFRRYQRNNRRMVRRSTMRVHLNAKD